MQKKFIGILSACFLTSTIWVGSSLAASPYYDNGNQGQQKPGGEYGKPSGNGQYDPQKGLLKQLQSIDKQLNKIEQNIVKYESKFTQWTNEDKQDGEGQDKDKDKDKNKDKDQDKDNPQLNEQTQQTASVQSYSVKDSNDKIDDNEDLEDELAEEIDGAVEEYNEYTGKFKALSNRLDGISKQLDNLITRGLDPALGAERTARIEELKVKLQASIDKITAVQDQVIDKIQKDHTAKVEDPKEETLTTKPWNIRFNKKLNEATLSELNIVVYDEQHQLIETTITHDAANKTVIVQPTQPYKVGSKYTLYIGKELSSEGGQKLKNSVKMQFTIR